MAVVGLEHGLGERRHEDVSRHGGIQLLERAATTRTALMDLSLMRLALRNLLSNALQGQPARRAGVRQDQRLRRPTCLADRSDRPGSGHRDRPPADAV